MRPEDVYIQYGVIVLPAFVLYLVHYLRMPAGSPWSSSIHVFLAASFVISLSMITYRIFGNAAEGVTMYEVGAASLSALGLSVVVAVIGMFLSGTRADYDGVDKWLPDTDKPEEEVQRIIVELELSEEVEIEALKMLEKSVDEGVLRGRGMNAVVPAVIYIAARENDDPRTLDEVASVSRATKKDIGRAYRHIGREMEFRVIPPSPVDYIDRFTSQLKLSDVVKQRARDLSKEAEEKGLISGKAPKSIAAASVFLAAYEKDEKRTMTEVSDILDVSTITLRERSKDFVRQLDLEKFPKHLEQSMEKSEI